MDKLSQSMEELHYIMPDKDLFPIAIFAGRGQLPKILIDDCLEKKREFKLFLLEKEDYEIDYSLHNPTTIGYGEVDRFLEILKSLKIQHIVFIGAVNKPNFSNLKVDKSGAILVAKIIANKILGDNAVLNTVIKFFEKAGFKILRIDQILDCVISDKITITHKIPNKLDFEAITLGAKAIKHFSKYDVGQAVVVSQKQIIAIEALEGTDNMIERCKNFKVDFYKDAILIKMKKHTQNTKADLPTIGVNTIQNCKDANISGIAIQANHTLILEKEKIIELANKLNIFITII